MLTLSYGYKKPESGDKGSTLFTALEQDIQRVNDHSHNGTDSALLTAQSITGITANILSANWVANGPTGHYRQAITLPAGFSYDTVQIGFRTSAGHVIYPTIEKISNTSYYIYTIDNTMTVTAVYGG